MPRNFDGTADYIEFSPGAVDITGAYTFAVLAKMNDDTERAGLMDGRTSAPAVCFDFSRRGGSEGTDPGALMVGNNAPVSSRAASVTFLVADGWCIVAATKATGTSTPRLHKVSLTAGTAAVHADGNAALASSNNSLAKVWLGRGGDGDDTQYTAYDVAVAAMWSTALTDAQLETLAASFSEWVYASPQNLWILDRAVVSANVADFMGGTGVQTAINVTTISTASAPIGYGQPTFLDDTLFVPTLSMPVIAAYYAEMENA